MRIPIALALAAVLLIPTLALAQENEGPVDVGAETASHTELEPLDVEFQSLTAMQMTPDGKLLAADAGAEQIKVINPKGKVIATYEPGFGPEALDVADDGTIYCGGKGKLAILDKQGKVLKTVDAPANIETPPSEMRRPWSKPSRVSGVAVADGAVYAAFGSGWSMGSKSKLFRFDRQLENPELRAEGLRGCCQRCDIVVNDNKLYLAENSVHRVVCYDDKGEILDKWGERSRNELQGFGSCCNPMNLAFDADGTLYTSESGIGRVKRYSVDGKFLGLVGYAGVERFSRAGHLAASCSNIAIAVVPDGSRVYVMDYKANKIRILQKKTP